VIRITLSVLFAALLSSCVSAQSCDPKTADLRHANLPTSVENDIVTEVAKELVKNFGNVLSDLPKPSNIALSTCTSFPKLAQNGRVILLTPGPDYPVIAGAGANADIWLFQQVGSHAVLILRGFGSPEGPASNSYYNGLLDFEISFQQPHENSGAIAVYRFNGKRYLLLDCNEWTEDDQGNEHDRPCPK